jgi:hypothetical protein
LIEQNFGILVNIMVSVELGFVDRYLVIMLVEVAA